MLRGPTATLLRRLGPRVSGGGGYCDGATRRRLAPPGAPSFLARFLSTPASSSTSPPLPSSAAACEEAKDADLEVNSGDSGARLSISVDRSGLYNPAEHSHEPSSDSELIKHLKSIIKFRSGLISVAEYMEEVLTDPHSGFNINRDVFGESGDFITSPEVSQMFGEGSAKFVNFTKALSINLVECSPTLQKLQYHTLKCEDEPVGDGKRTVSKFLAPLSIGMPLSNRELRTNCAQSPRGVGAGSHS